MGVINNNTSYTNKDFQSIYAELLDIIPNLTNRWNPSSEADPGMVLVKLMAVLGDKLNYNIDKQILECFPGSVTQRKNARQMFNLIGYDMSWYSAAKVSVGFKLKENLVNQDEDGFTDVTIPKFTQITDSKQSISFYTTSDVTLRGEDTETIKYVEAVQGNLVEYSVNNSPDINLSNLDEDYKLYLSDINVAENAIFIADKDAEVYDWKQVSNIDAQPLGTKAFEFGVSEDESQCYLKFPSDVNILCKDDSLNISYITCDGNNGNIVSNVLSNFGSNVKDDEGVAVENKIVIIQPDATTTGKDPESIEEAYKNSRKTIGTFNTLVTKKDFENHIKTLEDGSRMPIVSNVVVADRNNDPNKVVRVKSLENFSTRDRLVYSNIAAYDLITYLLKYQPIDLNETSVICDSSYNASFVPVSEETTKLIIENMIDDVKAINIDINLADSADVCLYKGIYKLKAELITAEKVTEDEARDLEMNVKKQTEKHYQAYNMTFGKDISYTELIDFITSVDSRIKAVSLSPVQYDLKKVVMQTAGTPSDLSDPTDYIEIIAKSIAQGNLQPYKLKDNFKVDFGQEGEIIQLDRISTSFTKALTTNAPYELRGGEVINMYAPKLRKSQSFTAGCKLTWEPRASIENSTPDGITSQSDAKGSYHILGAEHYYKIGTADDCIGNVTISYKDAEGKVVENRLSDGCLIYSSQAFVSNKKDQTINTGNSVDIYTDDKFTLGAKTKYIMYLNGSNGSTKTLSSGEEYLLGLNDYFVYYESVSASWVQLGSGYTIKNTGSASVVLDVVASIASLSKGNTDFSELKASLEIIDNDIVTLTQGCSIQLISKQSDISAPASITINDTPTELVVEQSGSTYEYGVLIVDGSGSYDIYENVRGVKYKIFTRLDIVYGSQAIKLYNGDKISYYSTQAPATLVNITGSDVQDVYVEFSNPISILGGSTAIDASGIELYKYTISANVNREDGLFLPSSSPYVLKNTGLFIKYLIPIHVKEGTSVTVTCTGSTNATVYSMDQYKTGGTLSNVYTSGDYVLVVPKEATSITFTITGAAQSVQVGDIHIVEDVNSAEMSGNNFTVDSTDVTANNNTNVFSKIIYKLNQLSGQYKFNYLYNVLKEEKCIHPTEAASFFNPNHVYNDFIIAQMDTSDYDIKVNQFSIK